MTTLDQRRPDKLRGGGGSGYVAVPDRSLLVYQVTMVCLIVLGTVCLSSLALYFAVARPLKREMAALHADNQAMSAELGKIKVSLTAAHSKLSKVDGIQQSLARIEQQLGDIKEQFTNFRRHSSFSGSGHGREQSYSTAGLGGGSSGAAALLVLLLILGGLGAIGGAAKR